VKKIFFLLMTVSILYSGERKILVEMFTNSHCPVCPPAHAALNSYTTTSANASRVRYIFYHTTFPYSDDQLSAANTTEPNARNTYYNGPTSTPNTFFDGVNQGRTYSSFGANLDARMSADSPLEIKLSGTKNLVSFSVTASITQTSTITQSDLVIHIVAVENVSYTGRNGVSPQNFVMRKMITTVAGESFSPEPNSPKSISKTVQITNATDMNNVGIVVFVQSVSTKEVFQSEYISYGTLTDVENKTVVSPRKFALEQNYPNPFNPSTTITFQTPSTEFVSLKVFDIIGNETAVLVNEYLPAGMHSISFNASHLSSGVYFYKLQTVNNISIRKMLLIK